jgi:hypothetical protein
MTNTERFLELAAIQKLLWLGIDFENDDDEYTIYDEGALDELIDRLSDLLLDMARDINGGQETLLKEFPWLYQIKDQA